MKRIWCLAPALAVALLAQESSSISREGNYWVETVTGSATVEDTLRVEAPGSITVQGMDRSDVTYTLKRRAKAGSEKAARSALERIVVKSYAHGNRTVIEVISGSSRTGVDLRLEVPRRLRETVLASSGGSIHGFDLNGTLRADTGGGSVEVDRIHGIVALRTGGGAMRVGKVVGKLECYTGGGAIVAESLGGDAEFNTGGGEITIRDARAMVRAATGGGSIRVERASNGVHAEAGAGLIEVIESGGPVSAETGAGSIRIRGASNVRCESGSGTIHLQAVSGGVRAETGSGGIIAEFAAGGKLQGSHLTTGMGDITVIIPSNVAVTIEAINTTPGSHRIISDFPAIRPRVDEGNARSEARGALNGGGPVLRLDASGGTIYVRQQK